MTRTWPPLPLLLAFSGALLFHVQGCATGADGPPDMDPLRPQVGGGRPESPRGEHLLDLGITTGRSPGTRGEHAPVKDGDLVFLGRTPTAGPVLELAVRARGLQPADVTLAYRLAVAPSGEVLAEGALRVDLELTTGGWAEAVGLPVLVDGDPAALGGERVQLEVLATDVTGRSARDGWTVRLAESGCAPQVLARDAAITPGLAADAGWLYWTNRDAAPGVRGWVQRIAVSGGSPVRLLEHGQPSASLPRRAGDELFFLREGSGYLALSVWRLPAAGGPPTGSFGHAVRDFVVDDEAVTWSTFEEGGLWRSPLGGGEPVALVTGADPGRLALGDGFVAWVDGDRTLRRHDAAGGSVALATLANAVVALATDGASLLAVDRAGRLHRVGAAGEGVVATRPLLPVGDVVDRATIALGPPASGRILVALADVGTGGGGPTGLVTVDEGLGEPRWLVEGARPAGLVLAGGRIAYTDATDDTLRVLPLACAE